MPAPRPGTGPPARPSRWIGAGFALALLGAAALGIAALLAESAEVALLAPVIAVGAIACARYPSAGVIGVLVVTGFAGTITAFVYTGVRSLVDFALVALWVGTIATYLTGRRRQVWIWPGLVALVLYIALTAVEIFSAESVEVGWQSFHVSAWLMTPVVLVAIAPWSAATHRRIACAALVVAIAVGLYAVLRWIVGPAPEEALVARRALPALPASELRFWGSFPTAQKLALWCGTMLPFALAIGLGWRGWWRYAAIAVVGLCGFAVFASEVRTGLLAAGAGAFATLMLYLLSRAYPGGTRLAAGLAAIAAIGVIGVGGYAIVISGSEESASRYERLLDPTTDPAFSARLDRWELALDDVEEHPFGRGLGTIGTVVSFRGELDPLTPTFLDSSYLKIAFEQGFAVMIFFLLSLVLLLIGLVSRSLTATDPVRAALAIGAGGTLVTLIVFFFAGLYAESLEVVAAWFLVGLGLAQFSGAAREPRAQTGGRG